MKRTEVTPKNVSSGYTLVFFHNLTEIKRNCGLPKQCVCYNVIKCIALKLKNLFKLVKTTY